MIWILVAGILFVVVSVCLTCAAIRKERLSEVLAVRHPCLECGADLRHRGLHLDTCNSKQIFHNEIGWWVRLPGGSAIGGYKTQEIALEVDSTLSRTRLSQREWLSNLSKENSDGAGSTVLSSGS